MNGESYSDNKKQPDTSRYPDIEVYLQTNNTVDILAWLAQCFDSISAGINAANTIKLNGYLQGHTIPIAITQRAAGKHFTSVTFDSNNTPWASDLDCARAAFAHLGIEVRCSASSWTENSEAPEEQDKEDWWKITEEGEFRISWLN